MTVAAIAEGAVQAPARTAVVFNDRALSYGQFAAAIAAVQGAIASQRIEAPGLVILALGNLLDAWIFGMAARGLGLTTLIGRSTDEIAVVGLTDVRCVLASAADPWSGLEEACARAGRRLVVIGPELIARGGAGRAVACAPGNHILQTSGTTGAYKMVLIDAALMMKELRARQALFGLARDSIVSLADFGGWTGIGYKSACATWLAGGAVILNQQRERRFILAAPGLTHAHLIPQMLIAMLTAPGPLAPRSDTLRLIVTGGPTTQTLADEVKARITPHLFNSVAATETAIFTFTPLETPDDRRWHKPAPGVRLGVVDEEGRPVPAGAVGRLRVSTADGPTGYLGDPAASAAFFESGWFYPGDLAVMRRDGRIALHGRLTEVINVSGHKIAPAPIEEALREQLGVTGVCLYSMQDEAGEEQLHVAVETPNPLDLAVVAAALRKRIDGFASAQVHQLRALPRNELGKVRREALQVMISRAAPSGT